MSKDNGRKNREKTPFIIQKGVLPRCVYIVSGETEMRISWHISVYKIIIVSPQNYPYINCKVKWSFFYPFFLIVN